MTLAASSQRSQIIRSKFRSVLQLRIHRRYQDPKLSVPDSDPWISASRPTLAQAPAVPSGPAPFLFRPGAQGPEPEHCPWRSLKKEPSKISTHWREPEQQGNLTYHQYMPPESREGSRANPQAERSAQGPRGPPLWEGANSQQSASRMTPTPLNPSAPGVPSPLPPAHKLELQTLKLEELTVSELRQQLRLRGLPVSGTKAMLLERMRGGTPSRERPKSRREDSPAGGPWPRFRPKAPGASRRPGSCKSRASSQPPPLPRATENSVTTPVLTPARAPTPPPEPTLPSGPAPTALTLEEELQEAIRRAQLLPNRGIDDILEDQLEPEDPQPPIPLDFPGSFDVLSPSPDSEGLSSVFSSSIPSPVNSPPNSPRPPTDSLDWLEVLSGGPPLGCGPPAPSIFSADLSDSSSTRLWDLLEDPW
ncbi:MEF2-activating motif and SAP domain-containing transcriptional regulator [Sorex araneus]|uniref:MEF2-activating motif and SAP domain-containing transcriptional regulator n=1 Tax=Sorex araneus TaxID=42254 RepID=UPI002433F9AF|nr:MEF2-activating motif and SAP domain-containing transcriptional regulator [Sorex araneus]